MSWSGKRYDTPIVGFGSTAHKIIRQQYSSPIGQFLMQLDRPRNTLSPQLRDNGEHELVRRSQHILMLADDDALDQIIAYLGKTRLAIRSDPESFVTLILIGSDCLRNVALDEIKVLLGPAHVVLRFSRNRKEWFPIEKISQVLKVLVLPMHLDEVVDFDLAADYRDVFANVGGPISVAEWLIDVRYAKPLKEFYRFLGSSKFWSICNQSSAFVSLRGNASLPLRFNRRLDVLGRVHEHIRSPEKLTLSICNDTTLPPTVVAFTLFSARNCCV